VDGYIAILHKFGNQCTDVKYEVLTIYGLKYILNYDVCNIHYMYIIYIILSNTVL